MPATPATTATAGKRMTLRLSTRVNSKGQAIYYAAPTPYDVGFITATSREGLMWQVEAYDRSIAATSGAASQLPENPSPPPTRRG